MAAASDLPGGQAGLVRLAGDLQVQFSLWFLSLLEGRDGPSAGTVACEGALKIRVARIGDETTQGKILKLVSEAERHRAPVLRAAEVYARWFSPVVLLFAGAVWIATADVHRAVTVLIVGCPCAFVLATPTACPSKWLPGGVCGRSGAPTAGRIGFRRPAAPDDTRNKGLPGGRDNRCPVSG